MKDVLITAKAIKDVDKRRFSTAAKIVYGREELDRYGDSSVGDILKRLPGVTLSGTPGRGGDIRMRGLGNGYTMILINGEPAPRGFSMDSLAPEQIEQIEIMRAPVAEHSARAIAGIINIVLRENHVRRDNQGRFALGWENGHLQPSFSFQRGDTLNDFSYNINANVAHRNQTSETQTHTEARNALTSTPTLLQTQQDKSQAISDNLHLGTRLNWKLTGGDSLIVMPFLMASRNTTFGTSLRDTPIGDGIYRTANWRTESDSTLFRAMSTWRHKLDNDARLEIRLNGNYADSSSQTSRHEYDAAGLPAHTTLSHSGIRDSGFSNAGKYTQSTQPGQSFSLGWEVEQSHRNETDTTVQDGVVQLAQYGTTLEAGTRRYALFGQRDWDVTPLWSAYAGLRWESVHTRSDWLNNAIENDSSVASPLLHSVWRFTEESKDQIRLSLTRSYKSPTLANLVPRPRLASGYPASGTNTATSPDTSGNPFLKPELAWGLDLAYEHYFSEGGLVSIGGFRRNIENLIRNVTSLQTVGWSPSQRWLSSPQNFGQAVTQGLELEAKLRLPEVYPEAPPIDLRANYSRFWSHVDGVVGPNNRLDQQPTFTANLGADYRLRSLPLTLGGNMNWTPAYSVQQTDNQIYGQGLKRVFDLYALWRFDPNTQLRLSASNLLHADYATANQATFGPIDQVARTVTKTYLTWAARLELKY
ncbi:TonB-dependent receptor plug domain-containing protein [Denitratisoma sp. DHT3]|uniref:TonB-dependent receptor plug domain-containing protein n=1 Tax=Denitratisoma sp. DHT3 TaxID=1981880 RepID=UPI001648541D|nr:TonB-dependent receptor [Denitratisoma sp. DHT3]